MVGVGCVIARSARSRTVRAGSEPARTGIIDVKAGEMLTGDFRTLPYGDNTPKHVFMAMGTNRNKIRARLRIIVIF